jgi:predicted metal-binding protein
MKFTNNTVHQQGDAFMKKINIGIIICHRYHTCAGGKCFRAARTHEGAFSIYHNKEIDIVGYTTCDGCPGGNVEYAPDEMKNNGATVVHLATGLVVGYPPCPYIENFKSLIKEKYDMDVVIGTHPIPQKYYVTHMALKTWNTPVWKNFIKPTLANEEIRRAYD